jgi:hypothetical protein
LNSSESGAEAIIFEPAELGKENKTDRKISKGFSMLAALCLSDCADPQMWPQ